MLYGVFMGLRYEQSGVNIELGDDASRVLYNAAKVTWDYRKDKVGEVFCPFDDFSGLRAVRIGGLPDDAIMSFGFDGIGTKTELAERTGRHDTVAYDLLAMVCDDAVVRGGEPALVGSILVLRSLGEDGNSYIDFVKQLAKGYIEAAKAANVAVINGEIAELGARVQGRGAFNYNWGAGCVWFARKNRLFKGDEIKVGDKLVALREKGPRSNGLSLFRKILTDIYGSDWDVAAACEGYADKILHPSQIYSAAIVDMFGGFDSEPQADVHGVAHITGGGVPGKVGRMLKPSGLGAYFKDLYKPCEIMLTMQQLGDVSDEDAYGTWNMGQGGVVATPEPDNVLRVAKKHGIHAKVVGEVTEEPGIIIKSKGLKAPNKELKFAA
jgi:phosphoribosylformylglycinamidine cyclo-ligase